MKLITSFILFYSLFASAAFAAPVSINGAGATFPYPLYTKWFSEFQKVDADAQINYQSLGSGAGIRQLQEKTVDFGASDSPMTDEQMAKSTSPVVHLPTVLGAVVVTYNLPGIAKGLKLNGAIIAEIYMGKIAKWSDPKIVALNKGEKLPDLPILSVHRSDGSGTTGIFTDYLAKVSPEWKAGPGQGTSVNWTGGLGGKGNEGVTGIIKQSAGSIGYVELIYAENNGLPYAAIENTTKAFVLPSTKSVAAAAAGAMKTIPADFRVSITNAAGKDAYPISGFTYILVYSTLPKEKGAKIVHFLKWAMNDGQKFAVPLFYAPLPKELAKKVEAKISTLKLQ
jgi:phosphate transport system substrate-binding protein